VRNNRGPIPAIPFYVNFFCFAAFIRTEDYIPKENEAGKPGSVRDQRRYPLQRAILGISTLCSLSSCSKLEGDFVP